MQTYRLDSYPGWTLHYLDRPKDFATHWPPPPPSGNPWLQGDTLAFLAGHPQGVHTGAALLEHADGERRLWLTVQSLDFRAAAQLGTGGLAGLVRGRVLVLGQLLTSLPVGWARSAKIGEPEVVGLLSATADQLARTTTAGTCRGIVLKDLFTDDSTAVADLSMRGYHRLPTEPAMVMDLQRFTDFADYLGQLKSKYRVAYRRSRARLGGLRRQLLSREEVARELPRLHELYRSVGERAAVDLVDLQPDYFRWLAGVGEVHAYLTDDDARRVVGFTTALSHGRALRQAHYLGMDEAFRQSHHLYQNMLYDLLADGIEGGSERIDFGRTAAESKSLLGARPLHSVSLVRLNSSWLNRLLPRLLPRFYASRAWEVRHPLREVTGVINPS